MHLQTLPPTLMEATCTHQLKPVDIHLALTMYTHQWTTVGTHLCSH